jgi:predicted transcriptional regulator
MPDDRALLVSVKPRYADLLLSGVKTVELRRVRPNVDPGCEVLLYASSPAMEMVGRARVEAIDVDDVDSIWRRYGPDTGVDRATFDAYFRGTRTGVAITLCDARRLGRGVPLSELRRRIKGFRPPQSFRYVPSGDVASVT